MQIWWVFTGVGVLCLWTPLHPDLRYILKLRVRHVWPPPQFWAGDAQWRIQKLWKVGADDSVATSSSFMAGVRTQQTICLLYGKRRQKIQSQWEYPSPLNRPLATPLSAFVGRLIFSGAWRQAIRSWAGLSMNLRLRALWYEYPSWQNFHISPVCFQFNASFDSVMQLGVKTNSLCARYLYR